MPVSEWEAGAMAARAGISRIEGGWMELKYCNSKSWRAFRGFLCCKTGIYFDVMSSDIFSRKYVRKYPLSTEERRRGMANEKCKATIAAEIVDDDQLMEAIKELEGECPFLDGLSKQDLWERVKQAEARIREETTVMAACFKRLKLL